MIACWLIELHASPLDYLAESISVENSYVPICTVSGQGKGFEEIAEHVLRQTTGAASYARAVDPIALPQQLLRSGTEQTVCVSFVFCQVIQVKLNL